MTSVERAFDIQTDEGVVEEAGLILPPAPSEPPDPAALETLVAEASDLDGLDMSGPQVLAELLGVEKRPDRIRRLLRTWISKINDAVARADLDDVVAWMHVVTRDPEPDGELDRSRAEAIEELATPALLEALVVALVDRADSELAAGLLGDLGAGPIIQLVEWMAVDDPPVSRRHIVDLLALAGRRDVRALAVHVADSRWFIVRNVCIALGRTGRAQAVDAVMSALDHGDDRVRVEALRSLAMLQGELAVPILLGALGDRSRRVRQAVASLLRASPSPQVVSGLVDIIESGSIDVAQAPGLVGLIAERKDPSVTPSLERLAAHRLAVGVRRAARDAARRALAQRAS